MLFTIFFFLLFFGTLFLLIFSCVKLARIPKEKNEERLKYKIFLGLSIAVLILYAAVIGFLIWIISSIAIHGM